MDFYDLKLPDLIKNNAVALLSDVRSVPAMKNKKNILINNRLIELLHKTYTSKSFSNDFPRKVEAPLMHC